MTERTSNIAESKKEMSEELPRPLLNLPWKCHMSIDWRHSSQRKRIYSRTSLCKGSPIRTKSRKAPKGSQLQDPLLPRNRKPPVYPPPLPPHRPLLCPPLIAVRLWRWIHKAAHRNHLEPRNRGHPLCQLHRLDQKTSKTIRLLSLHRGESRLAPPQSHAHSVHSVTVYSLCSPTSLKSGLLSRST